METAGHNPILAVAKGLPPGLWLPTAEESTDQYRAENFDHEHHEYEDIVDLGAFAVALLALDDSDSERVTLLPKEKDIEALYAAGYGVSRTRLKKYYGGYAPLHAALGFHTKFTPTPTPKQLVERLEWLNEYAFDPSVDLLDETITVHSVLLWGWQRNLIPSLATVQQLLPDYRKVIAEMFPVNQPIYRGRRTYHEAYQLCARALQDNDRVITCAQFNEQYKSKHIPNPSRMLEAMFGSYGAIWEEFGRIADARWMTPEDKVNAGVRYAIATHNPFMSVSKMAALSVQQKLPHPTRAEARNASFIPYTEAVKKGYEQYEALVKELRESSVTTEMCKLACQRFDTRPEFSDWLREHADILAKLSAYGPDQECVRQIIANGFSLLDDGLYDIQLEDFRSAMRRLKLKSKREVRFVIDLVPRLNTDEFLST